MKKVTFLSILKTSYPKIICFLLLSQLNIHFSFADPPEKLFRIRLNKGQKFANTKNALLELQLLKTDLKVSSMMVTFDPDIQKDWVKFQTSIPIELHGSDGSKSVYVYLKDDAGNVTGAETASIILDTTPPKNCMLQINDGAEYTNEKNLMVRLSFSAEDAVKLQVSNNESFTNAVWENFVAKRTWSLADRADGNKYVFARFMDVAGNISEIVNDSIKQDLTPPTGTVVINDNDKFTQGQLVYLTIKTNDAEEVRIVGLQARVIPFQKRLESHDYMLQEWWLDSLEGKKAVKVYFKDKAGNISPVPAMDDIIFDSQDPEKPLVSLDNGAKYSTNAAGKAILRIVLKEKPVNFTMQISHDEGFSDAKPIPFSPVIQAWQLDASTDGVKNVYVKVYDEAGNFSETAVATITLDRSAPVANSIMINNGDKFSVKKVVNLKLEASAADFMQISNLPTFPGATWIPFATEKTDWTLAGNEGPNMVYVKFKDEAGNISDPINSSIIVDTKVPIGTLTINDGKKLTNQQEVKLAFITNDIESEIQLANTTDFIDVEWQPTPKTLQWKLNDQDGEKVIIARLRDKAGNISPEFMNKIFLDKTAPQNPKILINNDSIYTRRVDKKVKVQLFATGATYMRLSENAEFAKSAWEPYKPIKEITLEGKDGEKTVYAQFKDDAENMSETVNDKITLDTQSPVAQTFIINNGEAVLNNPEKKVTIKAEAKEAKEMLVYQEGFIGKAKWVPYVTSISDIVLEGGDGPKVLYIMFKDEAGNISEKIKGQVNLKAKI